jgi:hypothetical protein
MKRDCMGRWSVVGGWIPQGRPVFPVRCRSPVFKEKEKKMKDGSINTPSSHSVVPGMLFNWIT